MMRDRTANIKKGYLVIFSNRAGFFALFFQVLGQIKRAEEYGLTPIVYFGKHNLYWSDDGFNDARNVWEYCFEPVSNVAIDDILQLPISTIEQARAADFINAEYTSYYAEDDDPTTKGSLHLPHGVELTNCWPKFDPGQDSIIENRRLEFFRLIQDYVKLKPQITAKFSGLINEYFDTNKLLGVHIRGEERAREIEGWYGKKYQGASVYIKHTKKYLKINPDSKVFLATDSYSAFKMFKKHFGDRLIVFPATRANDGLATHYSIGGPDLAIETLMDCLALSKCDYLIHGISNLAYAALCFNPDLDHKCIYQQSHFLFNRLFHIKLILKLLISKAKRIFFKYKKRGLSRIH